MDNDFQIPIFVLYKASLQRGRNFIWLLLFPFICEWKVECNVKPLPWEALVDVVTAVKVAVTFDHDTWDFFWHINLSAMLETELNVVQKPTLPQFSQQ